MMTLRQLAAEPPALPTRTMWYLADLQGECPGVGLDLIRQILARLQKEKKVKALGTGRGAKWEKPGN